MVVVGTIAVTSRRIPSVYSTNRDTLLTTKERSSVLFLASPRSWNVVWCKTADEIVNGLEPKRKPATAFSSEVVEAENFLAIMPVLVFYYSRERQVTVI